MAAILSRWDELICDKLWSKSIWSQLMMNIQTEILMDLGD